FSLGTTPLAYQIESWDNVAQKAALWVKVDVKGNDKAQSLTMHWGNSAAADESDGKKVFPKSEGWASVWHLSEKGSTVDGNYKDATENAAHGHGINISGDATAEGRIGNAVN